jgi:hypothetical protein
MLVSKNLKHKAGGKFGGKKCVPSTVTKFWREGDLFEEKFARTQGGGGAA